MKQYGKWLALCSLCVLLLGILGCGSGSASKPEPAAQAKAGQAAAKAGDGKTLVVYFSATGSTKRVAEWIAGDTRRGYLRPPARQALHGCRFGLQR